MSAAGERSPVPRRHADRCLPEELQTEILSRLPTPASIARFRCVCKSWRRLLSDDTEFIAKILFSDDGEEEEAHVLSHPHGGRLWYSIHSLPTLRPVSSGRLPGSDTMLIPFVACCSGGIFCIADLLNKWEIILWNPTTSETKTLKPIPSSLSAACGREFGFGFDPETGDYKVIVWIWAWGGKSPQEIYVHSLRKKNSWRRLRNHGSSPVPGGDRVGLVSSRAPKLANCHWIRLIGPEHLQLTTFNMSREAFTVLRLPKPPVKQQREKSSSSSTTTIPYSTRSSFHIAKGGSSSSSSCLVAVCSGNRTRTTSGIFLEVWVALDYVALERKECSWIRLYNVEAGDQVPAAGVWEYGKFFVRWSNCRKDSADIDMDNGVVDHKWSRMFLKRVAYVPSMVSLAGGRKKSLMRRAKDTCRSILSNSFYAKTR
ncbi:unnamed protein product [Linum trigynum]|uniref:F-box domain-containing protein n=1 Tax=Linum trigynum TaxID=586398 RepID=A0AAV2D1I9_9ROSI